MRETNYKDLTQTKERKKFMWLAFLMILLTIICLCLSSFILAATKQNMGSHVHVHFEPPAIDCLDYILNADGTLTVKGFKSGLEEYPTSLRIPSKYNEAIVTGIDDYAFDGNTIITSITIPETITHIGKHAFSNLPNLNKINYNVTGESHAITQDDDWIMQPIFENSGQAGLGITVNFGKNVIVVPDYLFYIEMYQLKLIKVNFLGDKVKYIGEVAFLDCDDLTEITIPNSVTYIGNGAFSGCSGLTTFTIPENVEFIDSQAFENCENLTELIINSRSIYLDERVLEEMLQPPIRYIKVLKSIDDGTGLISNAETIFGPVSEGDYNVYEVSWYS